MNRRYFATALLSLTMAACAPVGAGGRALTFAPPSRAETVEGTLLEARCYFTTQAQADDHTFCGFSAALANLPLFVLTPKRDVVFLTSPPAQMSSAVTKRVRVTGQRTPNGQLLRPLLIEVNMRGEWEALPL